MASALGVIVTKLKEQEDYWDATTSGEDLQMVVCQKLSTISLIHWSGMFLDRRQCHCL